MKRLLLALLLFQNGPQSAGVITGVVRSTNGTPAAGVRVYAIAAREGNDPGNAPDALESLAATDALGRYRLEVSAGRFYIASGSVGSPTYYPGTSELSSARVFLISEGTAVANVDFSSFVPASQTPTDVSALPLPPGSTGVVSGVIRFKDGTPASGLQVIITPASMTAAAAGNPLPGTLVLSSYRRQARSDANGRYRIDNVSPGTYTIAGGFAESPAFYPGTPDIREAKTITTISTTKLDALDFTVSIPPVGIRINGRVTAVEGFPAVGSTVQIENQTPLSAAALAIGLPQRTPGFQTPVGADGQFEFLDVLPGAYVLEASFSGTRPVHRNIVVAGQPVNDVDLSIPISVFSGRILWEDGSAFEDAQSFKDAIVTTVDDPSANTSTFMPISTAGTFARPIEAGEYRFSFRDLPDGYTVKSVTAGAGDLLHQTFKIADASSVKVEIHVAKKTEANVGEVLLSGMAIDAVSGKPSTAKRVILCCRDSGISERFSTPVRPDGSFEFASIPPGHYDAALEVPPGGQRLVVVHSGVEAGDAGASGIEILTTPRFRTVLATIVIEGGVDQSAIFPASVIFTGTLPHNRIVATPGDGGTWAAAVPSGDIYKATVENLPKGLTVKSVSGPVDVRNVVRGGNAIGSPPPDPAVVITLSPL